MRFVNNFVKILNFVIFVQIGLCANKAYQPRIMHANAWQDAILPLIISLDEVEKIDENLTNRAKMIEN